MMTAVRRKHWLLASLSLSALLLMLVLGGSKTPLAAIREQDGQELSSYRDVSSESSRLTAAAQSSSKQQQTPSSETRDSGPAAPLEESAAQQSAAVAVGGGGDPAPDTSSNSGGTSRNSRGEISSDIDEQSPPFRNPRPASSSGYNDQSPRSVSVPDGGSMAPAGNNATGEKTSAQLKKSSQNSLLELTITDIDPIPEKDSSAKGNVVKGKPRFSRRGKKFSNSVEMVKAFPQLLEAGVSAARFRVSRDYNKLAADVNFKPGFPVPKNQVKRILILTTWRSGSTFLGEIFNAYPGTFYSFEPLHDLLQKQHFEDGPMKPEIFARLKGIMNCELTGQEKYFDYVKNNTFLFSKNSRYWTSCAFNRAMCYEPKFFNQVCELMPVNVLKTVRMGAKPVEELLEDLTLDLRVIHLVRDPRGSMLSRLKLDWCKAPVCSDPAIVCRNLLNDLAYSERLQAKYPDRFILVRYEDLGTRPDEMVNLILDFVGLTYTDSVRRFVADHTSLDLQMIGSKSSPGSSRSTSRTRSYAKTRRRKPTNAYSTFRDTKSTTFAWRQHFNYSMVSSIQEVCEGPLQLLNLRKFDSEEDYRNSSLSVLLPEQA